MATNNDEFNLINVPSEAMDESISKEDFKFVHGDAKIHDQKFETKPTTFLKDCLKRFRKNKSSVVATFILGTLLVLSVVVPVLGFTDETHDISVSHPDIYYLEPKLFKAGTGFWDGTKTLKDIPVDTTSSNKADWGPDAEQFSPNAVSNLVIQEETYTNTATKFGKDGYVQYGYFESIKDDMEYVVLRNYSTIEEFNFKDAMSIDNFVTLDDVALRNSNENNKEYPNDYVSAKSALYFTFSKYSETHEIALTEYELAHNIDSAMESIDVKAKFDAYKTANSFEDSVITNPHFEIRVQNAKNEANSCTLIKSIAISSSSTVEKEKSLFESLSFTSGNECMTRTSSDTGFWTNYSSIAYSRKDVYLARAVLCSFTYDTYEAALGRANVAMFNTELQRYKNLGYLNYAITSTKKDGVYTVNQATFKCEILNEKKCPLAEPFKASDVEIDPKTGLVVKVNCVVMKYKSIYGLEKMPKYLLGTDKSGRDMFIYVFKGLRTSLLLGVMTTAICFIFGLIYGSVSGYFGGTVDLVMERVTDILSGVPWIVVMTIAILKLGSNFWTFALALCFTGWIGTAATTRTQFYRFRGREYVLASRTLGASHGRLIAKHILPNAMGTIITAAVLMVPSVIFSEATISYLGLGFKDLASLGVVLSDNQVELTNHPYLLIFPSVVIALLMISFNLFGNGLRDAVNPSLKGEGE